MTPTVDVYPVGVLGSLLICRRNLRYGAPRLRGDVRRLIGWARAGDWRAVKNSFNGYLAEPVPFPAELRRCGSGWTRRRALASLDRLARRAGVTLPP